MNKHDVGLLVSLDVLLEEANVTRSAQRLNISQPALSVQLARLRQLLNDPLLVPVEQGRGMRLTPRAAQLKAPLHDLLARLEQRVDAPYAFDPAIVERDFTIALNDNAATMVGLDLVERIRRQGNRGIRLALVQLNPEDVFDRAARGQLDLVIGTRAFLPATMRREDLMGDAFQVAQRRGHPRGTGPVTMEQYCDYEHVLVSTTGAYHSAIDDHLGAMGHRRRVSVSVQYYTTVPPLLERTDFLATLPTRFLQRFEHILDRFDLPFEVSPFRLQVGWHPRFDADLGHQWLREQLLLILTGLDDGT